jgi:organic hydroperoxide reductase OsmC/OhrA
MAELHQFRVVAWWASGSTGIAKSAATLNAIHFARPTAHGGLEGRWTPEDLLLCAIASCFTTTFRAVTQNSKFDYADLQVEVAGDIDSTDGRNQFSEVLIRPKLTILRDADQSQAVALLHQAAQLSLVSRALAIGQRFDPHVQVGQLQVINSSGIGSF